MDDSTLRGTYIEVEVESVRVSSSTPTQVGERPVIPKVLILVEKNTQFGPGRFLPVWINEYGAESIEIIRQGVKSPRPVYHDFTKNILDAIGSRVKAVAIVALKNDTFFACTVIELNEKAHYVDCTPSDAVALAMRAHAPIFVAEDVMSEAAQPMRK